MDEQVAIWGLVVATGSAIVASIVCYIVWPLACWAAGLLVRAVCALAACAALIHPAHRPRTTARPRPPVRP